MAVLVSDSKNLAVQIVNRDQNEIKIILPDPLTGNYREIYSESRKTGWEFFEDVYVMKNGTGFILRCYMTDWENLFIIHGWKADTQFTDFNWR
jgi:hypothetical protein